MFTHATRSATALHTKAKRIPIYYSTLPRMRPKNVIAALAVLAALIVLDMGVSAAQADPSDTTTPLTLAQQSQQGGAGNRPARPPREALEACTKQTSGSPCGFSGPDGHQITGTCRSPQANVPLACTPADMPRKG
ncbi:hypothetical protein [Antarctobacter heliothermus]|uniref:Uncharacterized protein n=1 Tax=Antarctobacter heliothermus TaxID=74033 RepID=A0A239FRD2_9RHOB|nr:hypothetical protein [Antarctobacter heliothermus]SNS59471.1 hypothetical protein SAMN04488078_10226 [Antarctobacter heliothermus]